MKCPKCGHEITEGHLICEKCGYEIRVVPDFDPSIDEPITDASELSDTKKDETDKDDGSRHFSFKRAAVYVYFAIAGAILLISFMIYQIHIQSLDYQLDHAAKLIEAGKYTEAEKYLTSSYNAHPESSDILFLEADDYYKMGRTDECLDSLGQIASGEDYELEEREKAYDEMIAIYDDKNDYVSIDKLLNDCEISDVTTKYQNYMAIAPRFSEKGGDYDGSITLKLSSNTSGDIYYTTDGTSPTTHSVKYRAPIKLDSGTYVISAVFVNKYGISSDISSAKYTVDVKKIDAPELVLESGNYTQPCMVTAEAETGCSIYYTVDNSMPSEDSILYTDPIPMPLGITNFKFIAIDDENGNSSDVSMRTYNLQISAAVTVPMASQLLHERMIALGYLSDDQGHKTGVDGIMTYKAGSVIRTTDGQDCYTIYEYETDGTGASMKTGSIFLVNIQNGSTYVLKYDEKKNFIASVF